MKRTGERDRSVDHANVPEPDDFLTILTAVSDFLSAAFRWRRRSRSGDVEPGESLIVEGMLACIDIPGLMRWRADLLGEPHSDLMPAKEE